MSEALCETESRNNAILSNMQHASVIPSIGANIDTFSAIATKIPWKRPMKNPDLGQFITLEQFSTLATAIQECQQHTLKLSGDSVNFALFFAQAQA